jgi:hypothetical protein
VHIYFRSSVISTSCLAIFDLTDHTPELTYNLGTARFEFLFNQIAQPKFVLKLRKSFQQRIPSLTKLIAVPNRALLRLGLQIEEGSDKKPCGNKRDAESATNN